MKLSEKWLFEWVNPELTTEQFINQLTMAGIEVESREPVAARFSKVVIGKIITITPHPNADKLRICQIDVGQENLFIVTNATNVYEGLKVPVALIGAEIPKNEGIDSHSSEYIVIKPAKLRGVDSAGMLCAAATLGLAEQSAGILELPDDAPVGRDIGDYLQLDDYILEFGLTPNRGDCLSVLGIAREIAALNNCNLVKSFSSPIPAKIHDTFTIDLLAGKHCPRYVGRIIRQINSAAKTPLWMQEKLRRSGIRSISAVVDITNYVMLEMGQPMHAFDLNQLHDKIEVRFAKSDEKLILLNLQEIALKTDSLIIADSKGPVALAGIMGGLHSSVTEKTTDIFLESAYFSPESVRVSNRTFNLNSDSLYRFERGVDPYRQELALERATELLLEIVGGSPSNNIVSKLNDYLPQLTVIPLRLERIHKILGISISELHVKDILTRLNMSFEEKQQNVLHVSVPSYRFDIRLEIDLIEEIVRLYGYERVNAQTPTAMPYYLPQAEALPLSRIKSLLQDRGYYEAITYSFIEPELQKLIDPNHSAIPLLNPLSLDMSVMRTSLWPGLIKAAMHNINRQQNNFKLFETGLRFLESSNGLLQQSVLSGIAVGNVLVEQWGAIAQPLDFYDIKNDIETILRLVHPNNDFDFHVGQHPALHPGQTAEVSIKGESIGYMGALHPELLTKLELPGPVFVFELQLFNLQQTFTTSFKTIPKFPSIRRDIALLVDQQITAQAIEQAIKKAAGKQLIKLVVFDVYQGKSIPEDKKSIALGLTLQDPSRTLTEEEVTIIMENILVTLNKELAATLRE